MFQSLTEKLQNVFSLLKGQKTLTEQNIADAVRQIRLALLDADVNYAVTGEFIRRVKEKALGQNLLQNVSPKEQFTHLIHEELVLLMGGEEASLDLKGKLSVLMVCGLQGSGKTTTCAKLASYISKTERQKKILLAACDLQRPAAVEQLKKLGSFLDVPVFFLSEESRPAVVAKAALERAKSEGFDVLIVDTAGRLQIDEPLMQELSNLKEILTPREVLFVANATTGQDAVRIAAEFDKQVQVTGTILTMLDGNARAGAAISIREVVKKPLKFEGVGEKIDDLQVFNPRSMADRILGMGDVINLVKKAKEVFNEKQTEELEKKLRKASFTYDDFLKQMGAVQRMGPLKGLLKMIPGFSGLENLDSATQEFSKFQAMIHSMTPLEREGKVDLSISRRKRIARGCGLLLEDVNRMKKNFDRLKQLFKKIPSKGGLTNLKKQMEGMKWR